MNVVAVDGSNAYFVGGVIEKRDASSGNIIWSISTGSGAINTAAAVDSTGLYVAGGVGGYSGGWIIQKIDKNSGSLIWSQFVPEAVYYLSDSIADICLTSSAVYITGARVYDTSNDWVTEKRSLVDGSLIWSAARYGAHEWPSSCAVSSDGSSVYVSGISWNGKYQFYTEKRGAVSGGLVWADMSSNGVSSAVRDLTVDNTGVYMGGYRGISQDGYGNTTSWVQRVEKRSLVNGSLVWVKEDTAPSPSFQNVLKLASDNTNLYKLVNSTTAGYFSFNKIDPVNGGTISNTVFSSSIGFGWMGTMSWSLFGDSFYLGGLGQETVQPPTPPCSFLCFFVVAPKPITTYFWAMEKRVGTPVCVANQNQACSSTANSCGTTNSGIVQCDGSCSAVVPANPAGYGNSCTSLPNACGTTSAGTIQCDSSCSVSSAPANPIGYNSICYSAPNACLMRNASTLKCDGTCDVVIPSNSLCPINGVCGTAASPQSSKPTGPSLCASGNSSQVLPASGNGPWTWSCSGSNLGTTASCSAPYLNTSGATCPNNICESSKGENPLTCPRDCKVKYKTF